MLFCAYENTNEKIKGDLFGIEQKHFELFTWKGSFFDSEAIMPAAESVNLSLCVLANRLRLAFVAKVFVSERTASVSVHILITLGIRKWV